MYIINSKNNFRFNAVSLIKKWAWWKRSIDRSSVWKALRTVKDFYYTRSENMSLKTAEYPNSSVWVHVFWRMWVHINAQITRVWFTFFFHASKCDIAEAIMVNLGMRGLTLLFLKHEIKGQCVNEVVQFLHKICIWSCDSFCRGTR